MTGVSTQLYFSSLTAYGAHILLTGLLTTLIPSYQGSIPVFWNPGSEAVDAFTCDWSGENNWLCPPPFLIPRVIRHTLKTGASGTLVMPKWPSAPFWPMLFPDGCTRAPFITEERTLHQSPYLVVTGLSGGSLFKGTPNTDLLAVRLVANRFTPS